ncbi:hypothetical protein FEV13_00580 (plasmid) [Stutzerimonas degradans]|nr:hypothetical protein FEV13_00580 [Stutzerimonas degradans]
MSVYQRFYVKTNAPRQVEQLIVATLGGDAWLEPNDKGEFLHPVSLDMEGQCSIRPARDWVGNLVDGGVCDGPSARWYYLPSIIEFGSAEASQVALALYDSPLVDLVAEDNEVSGNEDDAVATVIDSDHYLLHAQPNGGQQPTC